MTRAHQIDLYQVAPSDRPAIMASLAILTEFARVLVHELRIMFAMTIPAAGGREGKVGLDSMAFRTFHGCGIEIHLVQDQAEAG